MPWFRGVVAADERCWAGWARWPDLGAHEQLSAEAGSFGSATASFEGAIPADDKLQV